MRFTLPAALPSLRLLLVLNNLAGHKTPDFVLWLVAHGIMPLYTPLGGSCLNMAAPNGFPLQRILARRALAGQSPETPERIIHDLGRLWRRTGTKRRRPLYGAASAPPAARSLVDHRNYRNGYARIK